MTLSLPRLSYPLRLRAAGLLFLLLALLASPGAQAQTSPAWQRVVAAGQGTGFTRVLAIAADPAGNVYLTGTFTNTVSFGSHSLTSNGQYDLFVAKWSSATASFAWAQGAGGSRSDEGSGISVSGGSVYVTGSFIGAVSFGSITLPNNNAPGFSGDIVVAKLTDAGTSASWTWARQAGGIYDDFPGNIAVSGSNVYLSGTSQRQATFGSITVNNPGANAFVAKLVDAGPTAAFSWVQATGSPGFTMEPAPALAVAGPNVYVAGSFRAPTMNFGAITLTNQSDPGSPDLYLAKITDAGTTAGFTWAHSVGGPDYDEAIALAVNGPSVYLTGYFRSPTVRFGSVLLTNAIANTSPDIFVAKLTDAGSASTWTWAQRAGGTDIEQVTDIAVSGSSVYITGNFRSLSSPFGATTLTNIGADGGADIFVARLTDAGATGSFTWAQEAGSTLPDEGEALAVSGSTVYVGGQANGASRFGTQTMPTAANTYGGFLASFTDNVLASAQPTRPATLGLYPNPATHLVSVPALPIGTRVQLLDALGRVARETTVSAAAAVSVRGLAPGLYTLRATDAQGLAYAGKLVVE
ncbi:T9SS type A sorting domain-containing protein [Hymenobacter sp. BT175]|uniref:T9SS type A sorting domain-containing protein n=1 Tax=Hymenobacter translucens TaxID=2886507 RepID=UPI001D0EC2E6|nr:T9SS type A sorting domain-containing protein [Hymenobacter translucens]MCC2546561.1 T9SS type A sorting domain-containing protein [Hymenobacter translucens]